MVKRQGGGVFSLKAYRYSIVCPKLLATDSGGLLCGGGVGDYLFMSEVTKSFNCSLISLVT
jgi:hypothetical protein